MADVRSGLDPVDYRFIKKTPDAGFSPEKNKSIINETIKEAENYRKNWLNLRSTDLENRVDILSTYGRYRFNTGSKTLREFLGPEQYKAIIGEKLLSKIRVAKAASKLEQRTTYKNGVLL